MNKFFHFVKSHIIAVSVLFIAFSTTALGAAGFLRAQSAAERTRRFVRQCLACGLSPGGGCFCLGCAGAING